MTLLSKKLLLPILIGVSFTSVGIALIYCWFKKDDDGPTNKKQIYIGRHNLTRECKVPRQFVPAVIGRGGARIKDVENKSGTSIRFKEDNIENPDRICIIKGTLEGVNLAEAIIKTIIGSQPNIQTSEMLVPQQACKRIIGPGGDTIHQIQSSSGAKIIMEHVFHPSPQPDAERRIIIKGTPGQLISALEQIDDKITEDNEARKLLKSTPFIRLPRGTLSPRNTGVNGPDTFAETTKSTLKLDSNGSMEVYVSAMKSPSLFFIQLVGFGTIALDQLVADMTAYYNNKENCEMHILKNITVGQMVAAKFSFDQKWYRAEVLSLPVDGSCELYFVDYGDDEKVDVSFILELPTNFLSLRVQAVECSLANVRPCNDKWSEEACNRFAGLTWLAQWKILAAEVRGYKERIISYGGSRREGSPIPSLELYDLNDSKNINVAQELIKEGYAQPEDILSTISQPQSKTKKLNESIEVLETVTPVKDRTEEFVHKERTILSKDESDDPMKNGKDEYPQRSDSSKSKSPVVVNIAPAGYESDWSENSDEFELG